MSNERKLVEPTHISEATTIPMTSPEAPKTEECHDIENDVRIDVS